MSTQDTKKPSLLWRVLKIGTLVTGRYLFNIATRWTHPTAREFLRDRNLDPGIAEELAPGADIRVRVTGQATWLQRLLDRVPGPVNPLDGAWDRFCASRAMMGLSFDLHARHQMVFLKAEDDAIYDDFLYAPGLPSRKAMFDQTATHEIAHCGQANRATGDPFLIEDDADFRGTEALVTRAEDPAALRESFRQRACLRLPGAGQGLHDTILYMEAKWRGEPVPSGRDISDASVAAGLVVRAHLQMPPQEITHAEISGAAAGLALRRINLYLEAESRVKAGASPKP